MIIIDKKSNSISHKQILNLLLLMLKKNIHLRFLRRSLDKLNWINLKMMIKN